MVAAVAVFLCVWVFGIHACLVPVEAQKGHQILRNWGYRSGPPQLELQMGVNCRVCWELNSGPREELPVLNT